MAKSDSSTLLSVPGTVPSFKPMIVGTPTIVTVNVVVALPPSLSEILYVKVSVIVLPDGSATTVGLAKSGV